MTTSSERRLPPGRHGLPRSFIRENQRARILAAVAESMSAAGFAALTVEDIIARAGLSRRTFYELFKNKDEAFIAAYQDATQDLMERVGDAYRRETGGLARLRAALATILAFLAENPDIARMYFITGPATSAWAIERRDAVLSAFADMAERDIRELFPGCRTPRLNAEMIVGGAYHVVYTRVTLGEIDRLPDLTDALLHAILPAPDPA